MRGKTMTVLAMLCVASAAQAAENAGAWRAIQTNEFRQGFVAGIASYLLNQSSGPLRAAYAECLAGRTDLSLLGEVDAYMERHPETAPFTPDLAVSLALNELCAATIPTPPRMP
ncbi:MAG TPA: hypothetical protein VGM68_01725 [Rhizomicrobium sp.]|jgi:hypothetical protein